MSGSVYTIYGSSIPIHTVHRAINPPRILRCRVDTDPLLLCRLGHTC